MLKNISVILVEPEGSLNIGMVARAMKNCGITRLKIVNPVRYSEEDANFMACEAKDVVAGIEFYETLEDAFADETCTIGMTRRLSKKRTPFYYLDELGSNILKRSKKNRCALVFGRERTGLSNEELNACDYRVAIHTHKICGSLNLAQAVLLACYELFRRSDEVNLQTKTKKEKMNVFAARKMITPIYSNFDKTLQILGYQNVKDTNLRNTVVKSFKDICGRAGLREREVNMFQGIFSRIRDKIAQEDK